MSAACRKNFWPWLGSKRLSRRPIKAEQVTSEQAGQMERTMKAMQSELDELRAENRTLRMRQDALRPVLATVLQKQDEALRQSARCAVQTTEDGLAWEVVTEQCCLGGCDMAVYSFSAERDALLFAALLDACGYRPTHRTACPSCYSEYKKGQI